MLDNRISLISQFLSHIYYLFLLSLRVIKNIIKNFKFFSYNRSLLKCSKSVKIFHLLTSYEKYYRLKTIFNYLSIDLFVR